jgi:hypothetical protein
VRWVERRKEIARSAKLQGCLGHDPDNLHKQHRAETQRDGEQVYRLQQAPVIYAMVLRQCSKARNSRL